MLLFFYPAWLGVQEICIDLSGGKSGDAVGGWCWRGGEAILDVFSVGRRAVFGMVNFNAVNDSYGEERVLSVQIVCGCSVQ